MARRAELLRARRAELAVQPADLRELYVQRFARAVTGLGVFAGGMLVLIAGVDGSVYEALAATMPGTAPAPLATLFAAVGLGSVTLYFMARSMAERRYSLAMRAAVAETYELYRDIDRLEKVHPDRLGQAMSAGLSMWSRALPVMAALAMAPLWYVWLREMLFHGWPSTNWLEAELRLAAPSMLPLVVVFSSLALWLCRGFRPGRNPAPLWMPAAWTAAVLVPMLSTTVCACSEAAKPIGLAGMTVVFALASWWAGRDERRLAVHRSRILSTDP